MYALKIKKIGLKKTMYIYIYKQGWKSIHKKELVLSFSLVM
jgi:hypothetical protein